LQNGVNNLRKVGQIGELGATFKIPIDVTGAKNADGLPIKGALVPSSASIFERTPWGGHVQQNGFVPERYKRAR
jgi:hypothetical protein